MKARTKLGEEEEIHSDPSVSLSHTQETDCTSKDVSEQSSNFSVHQET